MATIYRGMDQAALDAQYDQSTLVLDMKTRMAEWTRRGTEIRDRLRPKTHAYGPHDDEQIDLYPGGGPVHLHIHGGAWRALSRVEGAMVADGLGGHAAVAVADFSLAPTAPLARMVDQVRRAFLWLHRRTDGPVFVSGHSSGAHLAACLLDAAWHDAEGLAPGTLGGAVLASGIYDLVPVRLSARNRYLDLTGTDVAALSPIRQHAVAAPVALFHGSGELPEFQRQSEAYGGALRAAGRDVEAVREAGADHFSIGEAFARPASSAIAAARAQTTSR